MESNAHQVPRDTVTLDADDSVPEPGLALGVDSGARDAEPLVAAPEALPETVTWPEISAKKTWMMNTIPPRDVGGPGQRAWRENLHCSNVGKE